MGVRLVQLYNKVIHQHCTGGNMYLQVERKKWCNIKIEKNEENYL